MIENAEEYCKYNKKIYEYNDHPFIGNERNMYSSFSAAVASITPLHLSEYSAKRHTRKVKGQEKQPVRTGRVDFWCNYNPTGYKDGGIGCFVELKRAWMSEFCETEKKSKSPPFKKSWDSLCKQVDSIKAWSRIEEEGAVRIIGLMVIYFFSTKKDYMGTPDKWNDKNYDKLFDIVETTLGKKLKYITMWKVPKAYRIIEFDNAKNHFVPAIIFASTYEVKPMR